MKPEKRNKVEMWLKKNEDILNCSGLDRKLNFPRGTMQKFYKYQRKLNDHRINKINRLIKRVFIEYDQINSK
ncbi:hypothetical protein GCM10007384_20590 [Aquimarina muelleri]|uniref:Uncharacterized protein n=1 Tax=Aquimarina muelleri TaxID=279356 RepID=A0A918JXW6_9FLAO|nr:hypothetical protein GCM10007384_20590 [Aquimarina muelleri]